MGFEIEKLFPSHKITSLGFPGNKRNYVEAIVKDKERNCVKFD